jgi:1-acyl-sn-glycerol-3-phosphate acyltransferase
MSERWREPVRFGLRTAAFVGSTLGIWSVLDAESLWRGKARRNEVLFKWVNRWAHTQLSILGVQLRAHGAYVEDGRSYPTRCSRGVGRVFIMNHRSAIDIVVSLALVQAHPVSRADLAGWPLFGSGARRMGALFVDRSSKRSGASVLQQMIRTVAEGEGVVLFPEGTAFSGDEVRKLQLGAFKTAMRNDAELIPIGVAYADDEAYFGDESFLDHARRVSGMATLPVVAEVGEPIRVEGRTMRELADHARERMQSLVVQARARLES